MLEDFKNSLGNESGGVTLDELRELIDCIQAELDKKVTRHGIDVRDYGAKADGVTDDSAAIQSAIDEIDKDFARCTSQERELLDSLKTALTLEVHNKQGANGGYWVNLWVKPEYLPAWQRLANRKDDV